MAIARACFAMKSSTFKRTCTYTNTSKHIQRDASHNIVNFLYAPNGTSIFAILSFSGRVRMDIWLEPSVMFMRTRGCVFNLYNMKNILNLDIFSIYMHANPRIPPPP